jgi:hypothetical protein
MCNPHDEQHAKGTALKTQQPTSLVKYIVPARHSCAKTTMSKVPKAPHKYK